ncbi:MAG: TatD family hydrolase [Tenuifilaceae bacterium]|jgi:TatD DNase family protein|nr:TatD family hydrolase [Tenuifilaceae bacterium]
MYLSQYIDFHTHSDNSSVNAINVNSLQIDKLDKSSLNDFFTAGIHPWNASLERVDKDIDRLRSLVSNPAFIGVGEIGLDKLKGPNLQEQITVLTKQLEFAYSFGKPVIIHCVKAWDELLAVKKKFPKGIAWAVHGFNGGSELAKQLVKHGFYLSIGDVILNDRSKVREAISTIPIEKLFLETDTSEVEIEVIYQAVSSILGLPTEKLKLQIANNFREFFNI